MDNYMKDFYEAQIKTSETKIKLMETGLKTLISRLNDVDVDELGCYVNAINSEKALLKTSKKNLEEYISGVAKKKQEARIKLGIAGVTHE